MSVKITITIDVDDYGNVSVDTGEDNVPIPNAQTGTPANVLNEQELLNQMTPFSLDPEEEEIHSERMDSPDNITRDAEELIAERADRFAHQFAGKMADDPVVGAAIGSLVDDGVLEAIEASAQNQAKEAIESPGTDEEY